MRRQVKTEVLTVRVTLDDRRAIERAAERDGLTVAEFMRAATLTVMLAGLDRHAIAQFGVGVVEAWREGSRKLRSEVVAKG